MDYKIFTYEEFNTLVYHWWDIMIKPEFPNVNYVIIEHDIHKRRTSNLGEATTRRVGGETVPYALSFSFRLLDGRFKIDMVEDVIKHEIGHLLDVLRNGKTSGHGKPYQKIAKEFGFNHHGTTKLNEGDKSEIHDLIVKYTKYEYKYFLVCDCGAEYRYKSRVKIISSMIKRGNTKMQCSCPQCKSDDKFTLYAAESFIDVNQGDYKEKYKLNSKVIK